MSLPPPISTTRRLSMPGYRKLTPSSGMNILQIINELMAAAIAYGLCPQGLLKASWRYVLFWYFYQLFTTGNLLLAVHRSKLALFFSTDGLSTLLNVLADSH